MGRKKSEVPFLLLLLLKLHLPLSDSNTLAASTPMSPAVEQMMTRRPTAKQRRADRKDSRDADRQERKDRERN